MAERIRTFDWATTPLGPIEEWPQSLRTSVNLLLDSAKPAYIGWGPELIALYNDPYRPVLGDRNADALGQPSALLFADIWEELEPLLAETLRGTPHHFVERKLRLDGKYPETSGWFNIDWTPLRDEAGDVAGFFGTIAQATDAVLARERLRESEERQAFLLKLTDALRPLSDPIRIETVATRLLGAHLHATRAFYVDLDPSGDGISPVVGFETGAVPLPRGLRLSEFGPRLLETYRSGRTMVVRDAESEPEFELQRDRYRAIGTRAAVGVPLVRSGRLVAVLAVHQAEPRDWTENELKLIGAVADRTWTWLERSRSDAAMRDSEERYRLIVENARDYAIFTTDPAGGITDWHDGAESVFGYAAAEAIGRNAAMLFTPEDIAAGEVEKELAVARTQGSAPNVRWHVRKDGGRVFIEGRTIALRADSGTLRGYLKIGQDVTERRYFEQALAESEERLHSLVVGIPQLVWRAGAPAKWTWASRQWSEFTGQSEEGSRGLGWLDKVHPADRQSALDSWAKAVEHDGFEADYRIHQAATDRYSWFQTRATPVRNAEGEIIEWLGTSTDVDELRTLQKRQQLLLAELQHRVRNILAMTRSVARRTLETANDVNDYASHLEGRLSAMARTQAVLTRNPGQGVDLEELVLDELEAQAARADQYRCRGPEIALSPKAAEVLTLSIHELATNATKYGAFATPKGRVDVHWKDEERDDARWLCLVWSEHGLDLGSFPVRPGFGTELITRRVPYELQGEGEIEMRPQGVRAVIRFPLAESRSILQTDADVKEAAR
ncbi:hypothetical protein SCH01S_15_00530 [Sphingomonas changbaiensis NBRC 104936]|uniref:histidine kinase n=2 Tax=Sphingomonas changbaiensis TaxID=529705 RepID=A0A0E9MLR1_9SPHN|nr:hypothetical protein SCH01S_15_00530 [Sphingomonas changbaiensis NBRC 104936]